MKQTLQDELRGVLLFLAIVWAGYLLSKVTAFELNDYGVTPRRLVGLIGIPTMPFLHASLHHIISNTVPLFILLMLLASTRTRFWSVVFALIVISGLLLWLFGRSARTHVGASALVFGLISFIVASGFFEKRLVPLLLAGLVGFLYGSSLVLGLLPRLDSNVSWEGHLCGFMAGVLVAYFASQQPSSG